MGVSFGALAHGDGHVHRFCAEHGTIEEGASLAQHASSGDGEGALAEEGMRLEQGLQPTLEHTECPLATLPLRDALKTSAGASGVTVARVLPQPPAVTSATHVPRSPLSVAPKASPPHS